MKIGVSAETNLFLETIGFFKKNKGNHFLFQKQYNLFSSDIYWLGKSVRDRLSKLSNMTSLPGNPGRARASCIEIVGAKVCRLYVGTMQRFLY